MNKWLLLFLISCSACRQYNDRSSPDEVQTQLIDKLTDVNIQFVKDETRQIDEFISRHNFLTKMTGTGLRYQIYKKASKQYSPVIHDHIRIDYRLFLLDGTLCYATDSIHHLELRLGEGTETRGLEEGLMLMKEGDRARLIVPAHLAFGLTGDGNKVPPASALYYDVTLLSVKK